MQRPHPTLAAILTSCAILVLSTFPSFVSAGQPEGGNTTTLVREPLAVQAGQEIELALSLKLPPGQKINEHAPSYVAAHVEDTNPPLRVREPLRSAEERVLLRIPANPGRFVLDIIGSVYYCPIANSRGVCSIRHFKIEQPLDIGSAAMSNSLLALELAI